MRALYALGLVWALALAWRVDGHLAARNRGRFIAEGRRLASAAARGGGDAALDRLAAEPDTRFVLLLDKAGRPQAARGAAPDPFALGRSPAAGVLELDDDGLAFLAPVEADGKKTGTLLWGRWTSSLAEDRARDRWALAAAIAWWAAAGAALLFMLSHMRRPWTRGVSRVK